MKKLGVLAVLVLAVMAIWPAASLATEQYNYRYSGVTATASFRQSDATGCITTETYVYAVDAVSAVGKMKYPFSWMYVNIYDYDRCRGELLREIYGSTELAPSEFSVSKNLTSATLRATVPVHHVTLGHWGTVEIDIHWTGSGSSYHGTSHYRDRGPDGSMMQNHSLGIQRGAVATGAVWDAEGDYARGDASYAYIMSVKSGTLVIWK